MESWVQGYLLCGGLWVTYTLMRRSRKGFSQKDLDKHLYENAHYLGGDPVRTKEWGNNRAVQFLSVLMAMLLWPIGVVIAIIDICKKWVA